MKKVLSKKMIVFLAFSAILFTLSVIRFVQQESIKAEKDSELAKKKSQYAELLEENEHLNAHLQSKMTSDVIADFAENVLGMRQITKSQVQYVEIQKEDVVTVYKEKNSLWDEFCDLFR